MFRKDLTRFRNGQFSGNTVTFSAMRVLPSIFSLNNGPYFIRKYEIFREVYQLGRKEPRVGRLASRKEKLLVSFASFLFHYACIYVFSLNHCELGGPQEGSPSCQIRWTANNFFAKTVGQLREKASSLIELLSIYGKCNFYDEDNNPGRNARSFCIRVITVFLIERTSRYVFRENDSPQQRRKREFLVMPTNSFSLFF